MQLFSVGQKAFGIIAVGQEAEGVVAIGQMATGVVAIGQMATGVIAIGQVARGFFAVGMVAIGLVSVGMLGVGVFAARAMLGAAALGGKLFVLPLMPFPRIDPYRVGEAEAVLAGRGRGFVPAELGMGEDRVPKLLAKDGSELPARVATELLEAARTRAAENERKVLAYLVPAEGGGFVAERLVAVPSAAASTGARVLVWALSLGALSAICAGFYLAVLIPIVELVVRLLNAP